MVLVARRSAQLSQRPAPLAVRAARSLLSTELGARSEVPLPVPRRAVRHASLPVVLFHLEAVVSVRRRVRALLDRARAPRSQPRTGIAGADARRGHRYVRFESPRALRRGSAS